MTIKADYRPDGVVTLEWDDGRLNTLDNDAFAAIEAAFDSAADAAAIVWCGREGFFSAGLNTKTLGLLDDDGLTTLLVNFGRTLMRVWLEPRPVVVAATGHAIAAGTMFAMAADHAVAAEGDFKWGLTETQIGFPLPEFGIALARSNVRTDRLDDLLLPGAVISPYEAVEVGYADELAPPEQVMLRAHEKALELAQLPRGAYAETKRRLRGRVVEAILGDLAHDVRSLVERRVLT